MVENLMDALILLRWNKNLISGLILFIQGAGSKWSYRSGIQGCRKCINKAKKYSFMKQILQFSFYKIRTLVKLFKLFIKIMNLLQNGVNTVCTKRTYFHFLDLFIEMPRLYYFLPCCSKNHYYKNQIF